MASPAAGTVSEAPALRIDERLQNLMRVHQKVILEERQFARECHEVFMNLELLNTNILDAKDLLKERAAEHADNLATINELRTRKDELDCETIRLNQQLKRLRKKYGDDTEAGGSIVDTGDNPSAKPILQPPDGAEPAPPAASSSAATMCDERLSMVKEIKLKMLQQCTGLILPEDAAPSEMSSSVKHDACITGVLKLAGDKELLPFSIDKTTNSAEQIEAELWRLVEQSCDPALLAELQIFINETEPETSAE